MTSLFFRLLATLFITMGIVACATADKTQLTKTPTAGASSAAPSISVQVKCINQEFSAVSNLTKHENKFVIIPYRKLKKPGKSIENKEVDETDDLYFERVSKMAEKTLLKAGLQKAKSTDRDALIVALSWNTKKKVLGWKKADIQIKNNNGNQELEKIQSGQIYLSNLHLKGVAPDKKTTRWEIEAESANADVYYLNVLPPLFAASADSIGKNCEMPIEKSIAKNSADINAIRSVEPQEN